MDFEAVYTEWAEVPWARGAPNPRTVDALKGRDGAGRTALVVGSAYGDDAEHVASLGYAVTAFDVSATAVARTRERFPGSAVEYRVADLLDPPAEWRRAFDLVVEVITVQSMPRDVRDRAIGAVAAFVGDELLVINAVSPDGVDAGGPPWPLTRAEMESFARDGLTLRSLDVVEGRWVAWLRR